jgi:hypothetical protein
VAGGSRLGSHAAEGQATPGAAGELGMVESGIDGDAREQIERNKAARRLLAEWMMDESGYDERAWPIVERLIEENPVSFGEPKHD